jgi:hypothetical protein
MRRRLKFLAVFLWGISFVLPTIAAKYGGSELGIQVFLRGLASLLYLFMFIFVPLHLLAFLSNVLMIRAIITLISGRRRREEWTPPIAITVMFGVNAALAMTAYGPPEANALLPGLLVRPGYYVWLLSFFILLIASYIEDDVMEPSRSV